MPDRGAPPRGAPNARFAARRAIVITLVASYVVLVLAASQGWPLWAIAAATVSMWVPVFAFEISWTYRNYGTLAALYVVTVLQTGHCIEHAVQMVQLHVLGLPGSQAHGIVGVLDNEWVHFVWNTAIAVAVFLLVPRFRRNLWLWATAVISGWHSVEHTAIIYAYLTTGLRGSPGLLARGGLLGGGLPIGVVELHFFYNVLETAPLIIAFVYQCHRSYQERDRSLQAVARTTYRSRLRLARVTATRW